MPLTISFNELIHRLQHRRAWLPGASRLYWGLEYPNEGNPMLTTILIAWGSVGVGFVLGTMWFGLCAGTD